MSETRTERDTSYWKCSKCGSHWSQSRESAERCCKAGAAYVPCSCSRCVDAYTRLHAERSEPAAASVPLPVSAPTGAEGPAKTWFDECEENR
jgi:hypothetical protein